MPWAQDWPRDLTLGWSVAIDGTHRRGILPRLPRPPPHGFLAVIFSARVSQFGDPQMSKKYCSEAVSTREAADRLGVCQATIHRAIARGEIRAFKVGRILRVPTAALQQLLNK